MDAVTMSKLIEAHNRELVAQAMRRRDQLGAAGARIRNMSLRHRLARLFRKLMI
jgi:TnpA family transposase